MKLNKREKILLIILAIVAVVAIAWQFGGELDLNLGAELAKKKEDLRIAKSVVELSDQTEDLNENALKQVGLFSESEDATTIFDNDQPQAVISKTIVKLSQKAGLKPNYQLNIKKLSGSKNEKIPIAARQFLINQIYLSALDQELKFWSAELEQIEAEAERIRQKEAELADMMFDVWGEDDDNETENTEVSEKDQAENTEEDQVEEIENESPDHAFALFPMIIPLELRIELIKYIRDQIRLEMVGAIKSRKGFIADQIKVLKSTSRSGWFAKKDPDGMGATFAKSSGLLEKFDVLIENYDENYGDEISLDYDAMVDSLAEYVDQIHKKQIDLKTPIAQATSTYQPDLYSVQMTFKGKIDQLGKLIYEIEKSTKWLYVSGLKISIANKNESVLGIDLSLIAKIL